MFVTENLLVTLFEMNVVGTRVAQVQATDKDKGDNANIQYSLLSGEFYTPVATLFYV